MATLDGRRQQLEDRLAELGDRLRRIEAERSDLTAPSPTGFAEEPANEQVLADLAETALHEVRMIRAALDRLDRGDYGICIHCGDPVPDERLDVLPATPLCRDCADR